MTYRETQLKNAEQELEKAHEKLRGAQTKKTRREADEMIVFWSNKTAFFSNVYYGAFEDEK